MAHQLMFHEDDPRLRRVREIALVLPEAQWKVSHGRPAFFTKRVFAYYGGAVRIGGDWVQYPQSVIVQADSAEREALRQRPDTFVPAYLGVSGWTGLTLDDETDWTLVTELIEDSYRLTAPSRLVAVLDEPGVIS